MTLDVNFIIKEYQDGRTQLSIAKEVGCSNTTISCILKENNIKTRNYGSYYKGKKFVRDSKRFQILSGYKIIYTPFHPYATKQGYVCEHRLVMEKYIKRFLRPDEIVHHKNGNKLDNRPENLLLTSRKEHASIHSEVSDFIKETGTRKCNKCEQIKVISDFTTRSKKPFVYAICKSCVNEASRRRRAYGLCS